MGYFFKGFGSILCVGGILVFITWKPLGEPDPQIANLALGIVLIAVFLIQAAFNGYQDVRIPHRITDLQHLLFILATYTDRCSSGPPPA